MLVSGSVIMEVWCQQMLLQNLTPIICPEWRFSHMSRVKTAHLNFLFNKDMHEFQFGLILKISYAIHIHTHFLPTLVFWNCSLFNNFFKGPAKPTRLVLPQNRPAPGGVDHAVPNMESKTDRCVRWILWVNACNLHRMQHWNLLG